MPKLPDRRKHVLCSLIEEIKTKALTLTDRLGPSTESRVQATEIYRLAQLVKLQALAMEKRLYLYKETIEGLGFKRVRRRKL